MLTVFWTGFIKKPKKMHEIKKADLHVHTNFSDGTFTPGQVVEHAEKIGLSCIAITDHDTVDGIKPALEAARGRDLEIIPGIEFTTEMDGFEIHMLGYMIDYEKKWFAEELKSLLSMREKRMTRMLECLKKEGINLTMEDVRSVSGEGSIGRLHLAKLLFEKKHVPSVKEAFNRFIGSGKSCYVKGDRISPIDVIEMVSRLGGVSVLAHPHIMGKDEFIPKFVKAGLKGIEVYHTDHAAAAVNHYKKIAEKFGLVATGGSDCHGIGKGKILMGTVTVPYEVVERLKDAR